ncbi:unnamed protein product [Kuraishia capsulata CBS 1993]|uniref:Pru domain-containing protein n=1 Tax=Kuraishia capsulata CBS 1993 TaxID=1382522 RepID=W6MFQ9_9ASCO|nr:uncharacterized protein KUCA_T00000173001 [Kuraishia capsulata CBS 1993]CDK24213.1 unnamed protein product [Kuraishia capsulata CBS 1993]
MSAILKFRAGKVQFDDSSRVCTPQPIKGEITVKQSEEGEDFYDFTWSPVDKTPGVSDEVLLVIPGDVTWKRVEACKTGRVYKLTFLSSGAKNLFWMQDPNDDDDDLSAETSKDKQIYAKLNGLFSEPED